jgi:hypothetical protein
MPPAPLKKGRELNSSLLKGIEGDLRKFFLNRFYAAPQILALN